MAGDGPLYEKFKVTRTDGADGPGGKREGCAYFVLDLRHDRYARQAAREYARQCERTHPRFAEDLRQLADREWEEQELQRAARALGFPPVAPGEGA